MYHECVFILVSLKRMSTTERIFIILQVSAFFRRIKINLLLTIGYLQNTGCVLGSFLILIFIFGLEQSGYTYFIYIYFLSIGNRLQYMIMAKRGF